MELADKLRKIADLLDLLKAGGLNNQMTPIDDNSTLEFTKDAYAFCSDSAEGRQMLQVLQSGGMGFFVHEESYRPDELDVLFEV